MVVLHNSLWIPISGYGYYYITMTDKQQYEGRSDANLTISFFIKLFNPFPCSQLKFILHLTKNSTQL